MQDIFGSVRRSLVFRSSSGEDEGRFGGLVDKIGSSIRKSRIGIFSRPPVSALQPLVKDNGRLIRWRKGELIGCGAFGRVYMGMNLDSGELIAVKQVLIAASSGSKEKTQAHIQELEEEVKLLKNLSHPNIVRYLGTAREEDSLNILLEFVPGGSISSLLGKFGSFPESVIRMYTKQLLLGLEYLHKNGIMHRDIKGANILVDNKGCIKLADFGASKKVVELATVNGAKSMKGTPYWMAPEVILQTGHSFSADIWSVGCTVIEMATGMPPWSQQYQEVAALFYIGTTKSHPPIPEHLSNEAKDFLLKCLQKEPQLRPVASYLLQSPFITGEYRESHPVFCSSSMESSRNLKATPAMDHNNFFNPVIRRSTCTGLKDVCGMSSVRCSTVYPEKFSETGAFWRASDSDNDMCQIDDNEVGTSVMFKSLLLSHDINKSFNPMCESTDDCPFKFEESSELHRSRVNLSSRQTTHEAATGSPRACGKREDEFTFPCEPLTAEDDDEVIESKIKAFLDEKALDLKKLQSPLYEEFYNTLNSSFHSGASGRPHGEYITKFLNLPPKSRSPHPVHSRRFSMVIDAVKAASPGSNNKGAPNANYMHERALQEIQSPQPSEWEVRTVGAPQKSISTSANFSERQRKWKEELDEELQRKRAMMRQAGVGGKTSSPKDWLLNRHTEQLRSQFPSK